MSKINQQLSFDFPNVIYFEGYPFLEFWKLYFMMNYNSEIFLTEYAFIYEQDSANLRAHSK